MINPGLLKHRITLLKPSAPERDGMGGYKPTVYTETETVSAMQRDKTSTHRQVVGDYVTVNTCYFVCRDFTGRLDVSTNWRIRYKGYDYTINSIVVLDDRLPHYVELEVTRIGGVG